MTHNTELNTDNKSSSSLITRLLFHDQYEHTANNQQNVTERTALFKVDLSFHLLTQLSDLTLYLSQILSLLKRQSSNHLFPSIATKRRKKLHPKCIWNSHHQLPVTLERNYERMWWESENGRERHRWPSRPHWNTSLPTSHENTSWMQITWA